MELQKLTITTKEMAKMLGVNLQAAYDLTRREGFPAIRVSEKRIVIPAEALEKWLADPANFIGAAKSKG